MITLSEYRSLVKDRPHKFSSSQVEFSNQGGKYPCHLCLHYYNGPIAQRSVCEIYIGKGVERMVPRDGTCMFWTKDGIKFPKLEDNE